MLLMLCSCFCHNFKTCVFPGRPRLVLSPQDQTVRLGENVTLFCRASGTPRPTITWTNEVGVAAQTSPRVSVLPTGDLYFVGVMIKDAGSYRCVAENDLGRDEARARLILVDLGEFRVSLDSHSKLHPLYQPLKFNY